MLRRTQPGVSSGVRFVLLFVVFAVFGWALQLKLSHYSPSVSTSDSVSATAKLLTEKHVEHSADAFAEDIANDPGQRMDVSVFSVIHEIPFPQIALYQVELSFCGSCRYDSDGPNSMHLPPPTIS
jgi:hypothetical protein